MTNDRILITGAAGTIGVLLRTRLARPGRMLRLVDVVPPAPGDAIEAITADVTDLSAMRAACADVTAVVHLGGRSGEDTWENILHTNVHGTRQVLEAARLAGVRRVILASSNHAVGMYEHEPDLPDDLIPRPDTYYGWSKAAMEALGRLYADRYGMDVIALRIGSCFAEPKNTRALSTWLSPDDAGRLIEACLTVPDPGYRVVWGVSANARGWWSLAGAGELGYQPRDNAEVFAEQIPASPQDADSARMVGGPFCWHPIGTADPPAG